MIIALIAAVIIPTVVGAVGLAWDPNTEPELSGYKLYYGPSTKNYTTNVNVNNVTTFDLPLIEDGTVFYIAATAYDLYGMESDFSNEVVWSKDATPPVVSRFGAVRQAGSNVAAITLEATDKMGIAGYMLTTTATKPLANDSRWVTAAPTTYAFSKTNNTVNAWAKDPSGNVSEAAKITIIVPGAPKNVRTQ